MKFLFCILLFWVILKVHKFIAWFQEINNTTSKKENKNRKSSMNIIDADYEEVE